MRLEAAEGGAGSQPLLGEDLGPSPALVSTLLPGTDVRGCGGAAPSSGLCPPVTPRSLARLEVPSPSVCLAKSLSSALFRAPPALKSADVAISSH